MEIIMKHIICSTLVLLVFAVHIQATETPFFIELKGHTATVSFATFSPNGKKIVTISQGDNTARIWDANSGKELQKLEGDARQLLSVGFSPDETKIIVTTGFHNTFFQMWDADSGKELRRFNLQNQIRDLVFSPDGKRIIILDFSGYTHMYNVDSGKKLRGFKEGLGLERNNYATFSPVEMKIATINDGGVIQIWDADSGKKLRQLATQANAVRQHADYIRIPPLFPSFAFSHNGTKIVTTKGDICDVDSGKILLQLEGLENTGLATSFIAFSPDGTKIVMGDTLGSVKLWNVDSGQNLSFHIPPL